MSLKQHRVPATGASPSQRVVIAGGPGSGKSTLLQALAASGERCYEEASCGLQLLHHDVLVFRKHFRKAIAAPDDRPRGENVAGCFARFF